MNILSINQDIDIILDDRGLFFGHILATVITILFVIIAIIITRKIAKPLTWRGKISLGITYLLLVSSILFAIIMWVEWFHLWY